ncbi:MAG: hypothetical protein EOP48_04635 [Sphingobacteriales bacterium]|nr:MAG: hypothetical protein EOP48_04635 [Sphingobacteriales bacterium]
MIYVHCSRFKCDLKISTPIKKDDVLISDPTVTNCKALLVNRGNSCSSDSTANNIRILKTIKTVLRHKPKTLLLYTIWPAINAKIKSAMKLTSPALKKSIKNQNPAPAIKYKYGSKREDNNFFI